MRKRTYMGFDGQLYNSAEDLYRANDEWAKINGSGIVFVGLDGVNYYSIDDVLEANKRIEGNTLERKLNRR